MAGKVEKLQNKQKSPIAGVPTGEECLGRMYWCKVSTKMAMDGYSWKLWFYFSATLNVMSVIDLLKLKA